MKDLGDYLKYKSVIQIIGSESAVNLFE